MRNLTFIVCLGGFVLLPLVGARPGLAFEFLGEIAVSGRAFPSDPLDPEQHGTHASIRLEPELFHDWEGGNQRFAVTLFGRLDSGDDERSHADIRELFWRKTFAREVDLYIGVRRVFWGVTETVHLVDIINQTDLVENIDTEDKLGQPMVSATWQPSWGTLDFFAMPYFRERTFPGRHGRLRPPLVVDTDNPVYESDAKETHFDAAVRYSNFVGDFDFGVAHFSGTSREPRLVPEIRSATDVVLVPHYDLLDQTSLDVQYTRGDWAWKLEAVSRELRGGRSTALVGGFEYTLVGILDSATDLGIVTEYQFDDQPDPVVSDNDIALGGRLTFNDVEDTDLLVFAAIDIHDGSVFASIEGDRRFGTNWELELEARLFESTNTEDPLHGLRKDDYVQLEIIRFF